MVLGLKPTGKPTTWMRKLSFGQNQGIVWPSDPNLWGNNYLEEKKIEFRKVGYLIKILSYSILGSNTIKG